MSNAPILPMETAPRMMLIYVTYPWGDIDHCVGYGDDLNSL